MKYPKGIKGHVISTAPAIVAIEYWIWLLSSNLNISDFWMGQLLLVGMVLTMTAVIMFVFGNAEAQR